MTAKLLVDRKWLGIPTTHLRIWDVEEKGAVAVSMYALPFEEWGQIQYTYPYITRCFVRNARRDLWEAVNPAPDEGSFQGDDFAEYYNIPHNGWGRLNDEIIIAHDPHIAGRVTRYDAVCEITLSGNQKMEMRRDDVDRMLERKKSPKKDWSESVYFYHQRIDDVIADIKFLMRNQLSNEHIRPHLQTALEAMEMVEKRASGYGRSVG